ncbi:hypothetical protein KPL70_011517 [Citrus sinensis]|nr:hypothetical protein KPL70_011517 [Citrus sinensis]
MADEALHGNEDARPLRDYAVHTVNDARSSIACPAVQANNFEIKPTIIQMIQTLRLFPFSLRDKAKEWLNSLPVGTITTWDGLAQTFLAKYFPPEKTAKLRNVITTFAQFEMKSLYEAWEKYKDLLRKCPHHGLPVWLQVHTFYNGLGSNTRTMIDVATGGMLMGKTPEAAYELLEEMASNNYQWTSERSMPRKIVGAHNIDVVTTLQMTALSNKLEHLNVSAIQTQVCELCRGNHISVNCQVGSPFASSSAKQAQQHGSLPSNTETNPKEQVNAIILRSGKQQLDEPRKEAKKVDEEQAEDTTKVSKASVNEDPSPHFCGKWPNCKNFVQGPSISSPCIHESP